MTTRKTIGNDQASLPFGALQLLAPPLRLVSAALFKTVKGRDVAQYGTVEEFVTSACDAAPGLLTLRHRARLTLGLRARLVLELCRVQPDPKTIAEHMKRIQVPVLPSSSSSLSNGERDYKIKAAVESMHALVQTLLTDAAEREYFFKEVFPSAYGTNYDQELEKLLWEFLIRLDQLLPIPSLAQTVSWLSDAPPVLEECARAASQPQLLKVLLKHQTCLGHLDPAASLPPNMGEGIITSLSLPLSGKVPSNASTSAPKTPFIKPVIGLISNDDVPLMVSISRRLQSETTMETTMETTSEKSVVSELSMRYTGVREKHNKEVGVNVLKRKHREDEDDVLRKVNGAKRRTPGSDRPTSEKLDAEDNRETLQTCLRDIGYTTLPIPHDDLLCSLWVSCLKKNPKVVVEKMDRNLPEPRRDSPIRRRIHRTVGSDDKENTPDSPVRSQRLSTRLKRNTVNGNTHAEMEDYVADSEDEATKNFKGRLFTKRYCKTKHGTYVPTLREYWKPCAESRNRLDPGSKYR